MSKPRLNAAERALLRTLLCERDLSGEDLSDSDFSGACLYQARFDKADLRLAWFRGADVSGSSFYDARAQNIDGIRTDFRNSYFWEAKMDKVQFKTPQWAKKALS